MNEAETRAELIDPKLKATGWGVLEGSRILREYHITAGKILTGGKRTKPLVADYVLVHKGRKLAAIEAKSDENEVGEGVGQAKNYADKCTWTILMPAMVKKYTRSICRAARKDWWTFSPHRMNSGA